MANPYLPERDGAPVADCCVEGQGYLLFGCWFESLCTWGLVQWIVALATRNLWYWSGAGLHEAPKARVYGALGLSGPSPAPVFRSNTQPHVRSTWLGYIVFSGFASFAGCGLTLRCHKPWICFCWMCAGRLDGFCGRAGGWAGRQNEQEMDERPRWATPSPCLLCLGGSPSTFGLVVAGGGGEYCLHDPLYRVWA